LGANIKRMGDRWFDALRPICKEACLAARSAQTTDVALFYLARWSQKKAKHDEPEAHAFEPSELREIADRIVRNLAEDGERVERLVQGDAIEFSKLNRLLMASARPRAGEAAPEYAEDALSRISIVLLTGTPPSRAAEELREGPRGPRNEYVFHAPFAYWARAVVIRLIIDEYRRAAREREGPSAPPARQRPPPLDGAILRQALDSLPRLVGEIRTLPPAQRSAMVRSLGRPEVDELVRERLHELAPDLFSGPGGDLVSSDSEIAERLGSTPHRVAANRSLARRRLAERDSGWKLLLDHLMPHASTRKGGPEEDAVGTAAGTTPKSDG
jgi:hypothetical protein